MKKQGADVIGAKAGAKPKKPYIQQDTIGSTQNAEIVYGIGDGENGGLIDGLRSIILDGTRVVGSSGEINFNEVKYEERFGLIDQPPLKLIEDTITERGLNLEVRSAAPVVSSFNNKDVDKFVVRISVPSLMQNKDNGDSVAASISYAIDISVDGGAYQTVVEARATEKITNGYEFDHEIEAPEGTQRTIRVRRTTPDSTSQLLIDKFYVAAISEVINAKFSHPTLHHIGLVFNAEQFNNIPKVVFHYYGRKIKVPVNYNPTTRQYDGIWNGTFKVVYSNNPAWVLFDILTDRRSGLGRRIPVELVDKWELYRIAQYCDELVPDGDGGMEPRFVCNNLVLNSKQDAYQVLKDIASIFRGQSFWNGSQVVTVADAPRDIDYAISMASVISYSYSGTARNARHNVVKVQYYDKNNEYAAAYEYATDYDSIRETEQINEVEIRAFGCTSAGQAQRLARYTLLSEQTETRILTAKLSMDAFVNMQIGDIFAWSDKFLAGANNGGRVVAVKGAELTLDRDVTGSALVGDTLFVNTTSGKASTRKITAINGNKVTLDAVMATTEPEFVWVIDSTELSLLYFKLDDYKVNPAEGTVDIVGIQHVNGKFAAIDTETALEAPTFSKVEIETLRAPGNVITSFNVRVDQGINIADLYVSWGQVKGATRYTVEFRRDSQAWRVLGTVTGLTHTIENVSAGIYEVRIRAADAIGNLSPYGFSAPINVAGIVLPPPKLASFSAVGKLLSIATKWTFPAGTEASLAVVIEHTTQDPKNVGVPTQKLNIPYPQTEYVFNGLGAHTQMWFRAAIVDKYSQEGEFTAWTTATADANPEELLDLISGHIGEGTLDKTLKGKIDGTADLAAATNELANAAKTAASNAQTTANSATAAAGNAKSAADAAQVTANAAVANAATAKSAADAAAAAAAKEVTDRKAAITAEASSRTTAITKETNDRKAAITAETNARAAAITAEASARAAAITAESTAIKNDSAAKVAALKAEVDPKIAALDNGVTKLTTDYKAADTQIVGQLDAYKASNDNAVASVLQKAESAVSTGTANSSAITAINAQVASLQGGKLDASVINNYYTKAQSDASADTIAAGKVEQFGARLVIGGSNLYFGPNPVVLRSQTSEGRVVFPAIASGNTQRFNYLTDDNLDLSGLQVGDPTIASIEIFVPSTDTSDYTIQFGTYRFSGSSYVYAPTVDVKTLPKDTWIKLTTAPGTYTSGQPATGINLVFNLVGKKTAGDEIRWRNFMMEKATTASSFVESDKATQAKLDANSTAIQTTNAEVVKANGRIDATNQAATVLSGRVGTVEGAVATKADASAVQALTTRVNNAEGVNTSQGSAITTLENTVNHTTTGLSSKASAAALTEVDNKVTAANGRIDAANAATTALTGRVSTVEGAVSTKAEASAVNALTTRVTNAEGVNTSQGTAITTLQNSVNHATTGLATKASTTALNATNSEVTRINGVVTTHTSQLTQLASDIVTINGNIATKADASALNNIYTKTQTDAKAAEIAAGQIATYDASLQIGGVNLIADSYTLNQSANNTAIYPISTQLVDGIYRFKRNESHPSKTLSNYTMKFIELPIGTVVTYSVKVRPIGTDVKLRPYVNTGGISGDLTDKLCKADVWTTLVVTFAISVSPMRVPGFISSDFPTEVWVEHKEYQIELGTKATAWSPAIVDVQSKLDANSTAIQNTNADVTSANGRIDAANAATTLLTGRVSTVEGALTTKADAVALQSLDTRVTSAEGVNTSQGNAITSLENSVNSSTSGLDTKASTSALTAVDNKVTDANGRIDATNSSVTNLQGRVSTVEGAVATKAEASALTALTTRVTNTENVNTSQGSAITSLSNSVNSATTGLATKASSTALTAVDNKVTAANGRIDTTNSNVTNLTGRVSTVEGAVATKADASALNALGTRVGTVEGGLASASSSITSLTNSLQTGSDSIKVLPTKATVDTAVKSNAAGLVSVVPDATVTGPGVLKFGGSGVSFNYFADTHMQFDPNVLYKIRFKAKRISGTGAFYLAMMPLNADKTQSVTINNTVNTPITISSAIYPLSGTLAATPVDVWKEGVHYIKGLSAGSTTGAGTLASPKTMPNLGAHLRLGAICPASTEFVVEYFTIEAADADGLDAANTAATTAAITATNTEVSRINGLVSGQATSITNLNATTASTLDSITIKDTRSTNEAPLWYWTNHAKRTVNEFKTQTAIGVSTFFGGTYCNLETKVYYSDASGGNIIQTATSGVDPSLYVQRQSSGAGSAAVWTAWSQPIKKLRDDVSSKADASAVTALTTRVTESENRLTSQGTAVTDLQNTINHSATGLATKASTTALNSTNSEVSRIDGVVVGHAGQLTNLASSIGTINGTLANKADASALNNIYTKTQADESAEAIAAGQIADYDSRLVIGGVNLLNGSSEAWQTASFGAWLHTIYDTIPLADLGLRVGDSIALSGEVEAPSTTDAGLQVSFVGNGAFEYTDFVEAGTSGRVGLVMEVPAGTTGLLISVGRYTMTGNSDTFKWRKLQLERGTKATEWSPSNADTKSALDANATAISTTNTEVARVEGKVDVASNQITTLGNRVSTVEGTLSNKADASALQALTTRVATEEGKSTSQGQAITTLNSSLATTNTNVTAAQNTANAAVNAAATANNTLTTKANTTAVNALTTRVSDVEGTISTHTNQLTQLGGTITTLTNGLATKADASALTNIYTKVQTDNAITGAISTYKATVDNELGQKLNASVINNYSTTANMNSSIATATTTLRSEIAGAVASAGNLVITGALEYGWYGGNGQIGGTADSADAYDPNYYPTTAGTKFATTLHALGQGPTGSTARIIWYTAEKAVIGSSDTHWRGDVGRTTVVTAPANTAFYRYGVIAKDADVTMVSGGGAVELRETAGVVNGISATKVVTVDNNGVLSGYGLISEIVNGQVTSQFGINANNFFIGAPSNNKKPFVVLTSTGIINGVSVPAGTYIDSAYIANATIKLAHINKASITALDALSANLGTFVSTGADGGKTTISGSSFLVQYPNGKNAIRMGRW